MNEEIVRWHLKIYGQVQGVGFRYRARYVADNLAVSGWVRNEWDGTVEMEVQGTNLQIQKMLELINQGSYIRIEDIVRKQMPPREDVGGFHIR